MVLGGCLADTCATSSGLGKHQDQGQCHSQREFVQLQVEFELKVPVRRLLEYQTDIKLND
jgi:hypothetical protein